MRNLFFIPFKIKKTSFKQASFRLLWAIALCTGLIAQNCSYDKEVSL